MISVLPRQFDNNYQGRRISLYVFYLITLMTLVRSLIHLLSSDGGAQSIASIPLDQYSEHAANGIITVFSLWGLSQLIMAIFYVIISLKYKSMVPLMYIFLIIEYVGRALIGISKPLYTLETPPGAWLNLIFIASLPILFYFSIKPRK
ncbi:MAG: hypothetical protein ACPGRE_10020 [Flavobacteriaceae bacterium]